MPGSGLASGGGSPKRRKKLSADVTASSSTSATSLGTSPYFSGSHNKDSCRTDRHGLGSGETILAVFACAARNKDAVFTSEGESNHSDFDLMEVLTSRHRQGFHRFTRGGKLEELEEEAEDCDVDTVLHHTGSNTSDDLLSPSPSFSHSSPNFSFGQPAGHGRRPPAAGPGDAEDIVVKICGVGSEGKEEQEEGGVAWPGVRGQLSAPPPRLSPYTLLQERLFQRAASSGRLEWYPWLCLSCCMLLNRTTGVQVRAVLFELFDRFDSPVKFILAQRREIKPLLQPLGMWVRRWKAMRECSFFYLFLDFDEVSELPGIGQYAQDAFDMFCRGRVQRIAPKDHMLAKYHAWVVARSTVESGDSNGGESSDSSTRSDAGHVVAAPPERNMTRAGRCSPFFQENYSPMGSKSDECKLAFSTHNGEALTKGSAMAAKKRQKRGQSCILSSQQKGFVPSLQQGNSPAALPTQESAKVVASEGGEVGSVSVVVVREAAASPGVLRLRIRLPGVRARLLESVGGKESNGAEAVGAAKQGTGRRARKQRKRKDPAKVTCVQSQVGSSCGQYRYRLTRLWAESLPRLCFFMLNPSSADNRLDDPTMRRCACFAKDNGFGSFDVVNLYAFRSASPAYLNRKAREGADIIGGEGNSLQVLNGYLDDSAAVCVAWGALKNTAQRKRAATVVEWLRTRPAKAAVRDARHDDVFNVTVVSGSTIASAPPAGNSKCDGEDSEEGNLGDGGNGKCAGEGEGRVQVASAPAVAPLPLLCLEHTKHGQPRHPLYVPKRYLLRPYDGDRPAVAEAVQALCAAVAKQAATRKTRQASVKQAHASEQVAAVSSAASGAGRKRRGKREPAVGR